MEWISVKDRMPDENDKVLAANIDEYEKNICILSGWMINKVFCVTHWMPLPPFPHEVDGSVFLMSNGREK